MANAPHHGERGGIMLLFYATGIEALVAARVTVEVKKIASTTLNRNRYIIKAIYGCVVCVDASTTVYETS